MKALIACLFGAWATLVVAENGQPLKRFDEEVERAYPGTPTLSVEQFLQLANRQHFVIVDAREPAERAVSVIPGAVDSEAFFKRSPAPSTQVLVYCTIGMRSAALTRELREGGFESFNLRGGVLAWAAAEQPFVDANGQPTRRIHVYGTRWNYLPAAFQAVW